MACINVCTNQIDTFVFAAILTEPRLMLLFGIFDFCFIFNRWIIVVFHGAGQQSCGGGGEMTPVVNGRIFTVRIYQDGLGD